MSKTKTVNGKDYRWDYKNKKWVQSHGASGGEALKKAASSVVGHVSSWFKKKDNKNTSKLKTPTKTENKGVSDHAKTGHTKLVKGPDGKVRRVKVTDTTKDKTIKGSDTSKTMKGKDQGDGGRADWLHKTRNSPAAKHFSDDERWAMQQRHRSWKKARKEGTLGDWEKKNAPNREPKYKNKPNKNKTKVKDKAKVPTKKKKKKVDHTGKPGGKYQFTTM